MRTGPAESLGELHLVRQMLEDPAYPRVPRAIDCRWRYEKRIAASAVGFNPFASSLFYGRTSFFADWLDDTARPVRDHNEGDFLWREVLAAVHDHLHAWGYRVVNALAPKLGLGTAPITRESLEDLAFGHLVTEAIATVGLDYWYLSAFDVNDVVSIGTPILNFGVSYRETDLPELRRFNPGFAVQEEAFFAALARLYCEGAFRGFELADLRRSPKLLRWLTHEVAYAVKQRQYARRWLAYLADETIVLTRAGERAPLSIDVPWRRDVVMGAARLLWRKVKEARDDEVAPLDRSRVWRTGASKTPDFRFVNVNAVASRARRAPEAASEACLFRQVVSRHDFAAAGERRLFRRLKELERARDVRGAEQLLRGCPRVAVDAREPRDLLLLG